MQQTYQVGIFRDPTSTGYHHYINFLTRGGGWTKIQIEETTNGDNAANGATRHIPDFLKSVWQFYFTTQPYAGIAVPPYDILFDDIEFSTDTYAPQNNETISNVAVLYRGSDKSWEISFNDKYKNNANAHATFEVRYSLAGPITNENWATARPVEVQADPRFYIQARTDGKFQKWWPYYQGVWAPFRLSATDTATLAPGKTVYFAVKDISQSPANQMLPMDGINGYWGAGKGGRNYSAYPTVFSYAADSLGLPYVKRIQYVVGATP